MASDKQLNITGEDPRDGVVPKRQRVVVAIVIATLVVVGAILLWYDSLGVPGDKKMARLMADIYTADALLQDYIPKGKNDKLVDDTYHTIFDHYGVTKAQYDSAISYYSTDPQRFATIYAQCVDILTERELMFKTYVENRDSIQRAIEISNDSLRRHFGRMPIFIKFPLDKKDTMSLHVENLLDTALLRLTFPIDSLTGGFITFKEKYTFARENKMDNALMRLVVTYADSTADSTQFNLEIGRKIVQKDALTIVNLKDSVPAVRVSVIPIAGLGLNESYVTLREFRLFHMPYEIIDSIDHVADIPPLFAY